MIRRLEREELLDVTQLGIRQPFDAVPCPDELRKRDLGKAPVGWVGNCSETVIILWFQVKIPQALEPGFLPSTGVSQNFQDHLGCWQKVC